MYSLPLTPPISLHSSRQQGEGSISEPLKAVSWIPLWWELLFYNRDLNLGPQLVLGSLKGINRCPSKTAVSWEKTVSPPEKGDHRESLRPLTTTASFRNHRLQWSSVTYHCVSVLNVQLVLYPSSLIWWERKYNPGHLSELCLGMLTQTRRAWKKNKRVWHALC
jgi:hypothetical protein